MSMYLVLVSDLRKPADRKVAERATKEGARRLVRDLNAQELARHGGRERLDDGLPVPLYFLAREDEHL
jgi:hypothetical protein